MATSGVSNSNQNRKLTPSKINIGARANSGMGQNQPGRNYEVKAKKGTTNSRSNTIELTQYERDSKKNIKGQKRA